MLPKEPVRTKANTRRIWLFRVLSVLLGLSPLLIGEFTLRVLDLPKRTRVDPFVDLHNLRPLFVRNQSGQMEISSERLRLFKPTTFPLAKPNGTLRVFALGGSTTQGEPYSTETAFPEWMGIALSTAIEKEVEVVNCGGLSYASYRVLAILREVLNYEADLIVVYTGHNEYLEARSYEGYERDNYVAQSRSWFHDLRSVQFLKNLQKSQPQTWVKSPSALQSEVDALLDYQGGLEDYSRDKLQHEAIEDHFRWNLSQMIVDCRSRSVPVIFIAPVSNLLDCPPIKMEVNRKLSASEIEEFQFYWQAARQAEHPAAAQEAIEEALRIDPQHAGAAYLLGKLLYEQGDVDAALSVLMSAKDTDVCPLRAPSNLRSAVVDIATQADVPCLDAGAFFASQTDSEGRRMPIVGNRWLVDHIHPSVEGHQVLGTAIAELILTNKVKGVSVRNNDWKSDLQTAFSEHLSTLGEAYFQRGKQRLEGLRMWTQGRTKKVRGQ